MSCGLARFVDAELTALDEPINPSEFISLVRVTCVVTVYFRIRGGKSFNAAQLPIRAVLFQLMGILRMLLVPIPDLSLHTSHESQKTSTYSSGYK